MVLKFCIFSTVRHSNRRCGYGMADGYFTDVVLHSLKHYHNERAIQLSVKVSAAFGAVILHFHGFSILFK